ncbi:MAG: hypothetical protein OQK12_05140 [Motiliproteus sp.]|nr:hypothetical protein [Motiliproteus sp.]MCW9052689.1 hypothetical protein [Motiliproteus sp.]
MNSPFPRTPCITLHDPLAAFLGAGNGDFVYDFNDVVKLSGHACPTVAGAFLMVIHALETLYGEEKPERGDIEVTIYSAQDEGVTGPISQVFTLLTGATSSNGFHGLAGKFCRSGLMDFVPGIETPAPFVFERLSTGQKVGLKYDPSSIPASGEMGSNLQAIFQGDSSAETHRKFSTGWRDRVLAILADRGKSTITLTTIG